MRIPVAALLILLAAPACAEPGDFPSQPGVRCVLEPDCLMQAGEVARRDGAALRLSLRDGSSRTYEDTPCPEEGVACPTYRLAAYLPGSGVLVVETDGASGPGAILVDTADGTESRLFASPVFSPSGQRLVVLADDFNGHGHEIAVWDRRDGRWGEGSRFGGSAGRPVESWTLRGWDGDDRIRLDYALVDPAVPGGKVDMRWDGGGWQVIQDPPVSVALQKGGAGGQQPQGQQDR